MDILASLSITKPICTSSIQQANVNQNNFFILPQQYQSLPPQPPQPILPPPRYNYYTKPMKNIDPLVEIRNFKKEKEMLLSTFDKIDPEDNGDIELAEFKSAMKRLNVSLTNTELEQVFKCMDTDNSGFIDKIDFVTFLTQPWKSLQLQVLKDAIVSKVRGQKDKKGKIVKSLDEHDNWSATDLYNAKKDMRQSMAMMMNKATNTHKRSESKHQEHILYNEFEEKKDPDFGKIENCEKWTRFEVAMWVQNTLRLNQYTRKFVEYGIDGVSLLNDVNRDNLMMNLGVKRVHVEKLLREIRVLKDKIRNKLVFDDDVISVKFIDYAYYDDSPKLCQICMANDKTHTLTCGHLYCNDCIHQLRRCAYCNKRIDTIIKLFNLF
eukprot:506842_1